MYFPLSLSSSSTFSALSLLPHSSLSLSSSATLHQLYRRQWRQLHRLGHTLCQSSPQPHSTMSASPEGSRTSSTTRYKLAKACAKDDYVNIAILELQNSVSEELKSYHSFLQAPEGVHCVCKRYPSLKIVTSEIDARLNDEYRVIPGIGEFGDRYFGTDD